MINVDQNIYAFLLSNVLMQHQFKLYCQIDVHKYFGDSYLSLAFLYLQYLEFSSRVNVRETTNFWAMRNGQATASLL